jgi:hypothetical protein
MDENKLPLGIFFNLIVQEEENHVPKGTKANNCVPTRKRG